MAKPTCFYGRPRRGDPDRAATLCGKPRKDRNCLNKVCVQAVLPGSAPHPAGRGWGPHQFNLRISTPAFKKKEAGQSVFLKFAVSCGFPLRSPYVRRQFGVASSRLLWGPGNLSREVTTSGDLWPTSRGSVDGQLLGGDAWGVDSY